MKRILCLILMLASVFTAVCGFTACEKEQKVKVIDLALSEEQYAFCVAQDNTELLQKANDFLKKIVENGKFDEICNNYFGDGTPFKFESATLDTSKEQLVVATSTGFEPFEMVDENRKYYGIDLEIAYYFAQELGVEVVIQDMQFEAVVNAVQTGTCDIGMAGLTITPDRQDVVTFTDSYYNASQVVIALENDTTFDACKTGDEVAKILAELTADKKIGCQKGTTGELYIKGDMSEGGLGFPGLKAECASYDYAALAITAMKQGQVNYVICDNGPAKAIAAKLNGN